jgi:hypothetical protein
MDKLPKLRRKPKPPTIETRVERTSTDTTGSTLSSNAVGGGAGVPVQLTEASSRPTTSHNGSPSTMNKPADSLGKMSWLQREQQTPTGKKSPFRNLRLRPSAKRARESSPAASGLGDPHAARQDGAKVRSNGSKSQGSLNGKEDVDMDRGEPSDPGPVMPSFLELDKEGRSGCPGRRECS